MPKYLVCVQGAWDVGFTDAEMVQCTFRCRRQYVPNVIVRQHPVVLLADVLKGRLWPCLLEQARAISRNNLEYHNNNGNSGFDSSDRECVCRTLKPLIRRLLMSTLEGPMYEPSSLVPLKYS